MGLAQINGGFSQKSHIFPTPLYLTLQRSDFPWNFATVAALKEN